MKTVRELVADESARDTVDGVVADLRRDVGDVVTKAAAARLLGVSRNTLDKWVDRGMVPVTRVGGVERVRRAELETIAATVAAIRELGQERSGVLAEALARLAEEPEIAGLEDEAKEGLAAAGRGRLVPLRIPADFDPAD